MHACQCACLFSERTPTALCNVCVSTYASKGPSRAGHSDARTKGSKHSPSSVNDLNVPVSLKGGGICRESSCVPAIVSGELSR